MKYVDIVLVKSQVDSGKLITTIDQFGNILLTDTFAGEAVAIGKLPEGYSFHEKGEWQPTRLYTSHHISSCTAWVAGWSCSECGYSTREKTNWCTCGADMRRATAPSTAFKEFLDTL